MLIVDVKIIRYW